MCNGRNFTSLANNDLLCEWNKNKLTITSNIIQDRAKPIIGSGTCSNCELMTATSLDFKSNSRGLNNVR